MDSIDNFSAFINKIQANLSNYRQKLLEYESKHNLKKYKFTEISAENALTIFQQIVQKFYKSHGQGQSSTWFQNQLKLYLWSVICYMELYRKSLNSMKKQDWQFFSTIFYVKDTILFEYQAKSLFDEQNKQNKWQNQQDEILFNIIIKDQKSKWNQIAKSLWLVSKMKYIRTSKQCRERWLNHLDPNKSKSQWSIRQYQVLFLQVEEKGKKWANIVKCLHDRRSQHSIKNRYNSIIKKQLKLTPELKETQAIKQLLKKIQKIIQYNEMTPNDQYLFGSSFKVLGIQGRNWQCEFNIKTKSKNNIFHDKQSQQNRKRIDNFRKKIQKIEFKHPNSAQTKNSSRKSSFNSSQKKQKINLRSNINRHNHGHNFTSTPLKIHDNNSNYHHYSNGNNIINNDDEIFYQESFDMEIDINNLNNVEGGVITLNLNMGGSNQNNNVNNENINLNKESNLHINNNQILFNNNINTNFINSNNYCNNVNNINHSNMMMVFNQDFKNIVDF